MTRDSAPPPEAGVERALAQVRGPGGALRRSTVGLSLGSALRLGGAGKRRVCCQSGCAGCPWTRLVEKRASRGLDVQIDGELAFDGSGPGERERAGPGEPDDQG